MTVGARLRSKAASSFARRGHLGRSRGAGDEETEAIVEHLEVEDEDPATQEGEHEESGRRAGTPSARRVHLAALPERYEPLEEPAPGDKPKKRYRRKLKKYGKVGPHGPARPDPGRTWSCFGWSCGRAAARTVTWRVALSVQTWASTRTLCLVGGKGVLKPW